MTSADVTVVIPCYNAAQWIRRAVTSALDQPAVAVEIIVVNDGSTDESLDVIQRIDGPVQVVNTPNSGACAARNRGLSQAQGRFVMFLDADDYIEGPFLASLVTALEQNNGDVGFGAFLKEYSADNKERYLPPTDFSLMSLLLLVHLSHIPPPVSLLWRRAFLNKKYWDETLSAAQDYAFLIDALIAGARCTSATVGNGVYFQHQSAFRISASRNYAQVKDRLRARQRTLDACREQGLLSPQLHEAVLNDMEIILRQAAACLDWKSFSTLEYIWRANGGSVRTGSRRHVIASRLFGVFIKERLANLLR